MKANFFYVVAIIVIAAITLGVNYKKGKNGKTITGECRGFSVGEKGLAMKITGETKL